MTSLPVMISAAGLIFVLALLVVARVRLRRTPQTRHAHA
jgi:hypothetical protein